MPPKRVVDLEGIESLAATLFDDPVERAKFKSSMVEGSSKEGALIVLQQAPAIQTFPYLPRQSWQPDFVIRLAESFKPGNHPLYEKGAFYSLDLSSVFAARAMLSIPKAPRRVLDLCSAPGGKGIFAWRAFKPQLLVCNEIIRKRTGTLINNLERCKIEGSLVASVDPTAWAQWYKDAFDLVLVDAPCSGQSLIAKGEDVPGCFGSRLITMNAQRQRRIIANGAHCVAPGGFLLYMTCTFAAAENENVINWLLEQFPEFEVWEVPALSAFASKIGPGYRLYPHSGLGAGSYCCILRREGFPPDPLPTLVPIRSIWKYGDVRVVKAKPVVAKAPEPETKPKQKWGGKGKRPPGRKKKSR